MTRPAAETALAAVVEELAAKPEAEQLALLPVPVLQGDGRAEKIRALVEQHRRGRPPGARNLATRQALDFVRQVLGDPLIERGRMAMHTPESLSLMLGCSKLEAARLLDDIRADLMGLFYPRLAPVDAQGNAVVPGFHLSIGGGQAAPEADRRPWDYLDLAPQKTQQNSGFSEGALPVSHGDVSHGKPK